MGQICGVTGGPDWLFGVVLGAGLLAFTYGLVWILLLVLQGKHVSVSGSARTRSRWSWLLLAFPAVLLAGQFIEDPVRSLIVYAVIAPAVATLYVVLRRARGTGVVPPAQSAPLGMFWVLIVVSVLALIASVTALVAMVALGRSVPC